jgi:hypothetical protein
VCRIAGHNAIFIEELFPCAGNVEDDPLRHSGHGPCNWTVKAACGSGGQSERGWGFVDWGFSVLLVSESLHKVVG